MLKRTRLIWKRKAQSALFSVSGMQDLLDQRERHALEDSMGFRGQWDEHRRFQIDQLRRRGLKPEHKVMEVGCGPLTAGIPVIDYLNPGCYVGVDVRSSVLNLAWEQIGRAGLSEKNPRLIRSSDFAERELADQQFDFVWSFSVLYHLADEILDGLFSAVSRRLATDGCFYANVMTDMENSTWLQFPFIRRTIEEYRNAAARHSLVTADLGTIEQLGFKLGGDERTNSFLEFRHSGK